LRDQREGSEGPTQALGDAETPDKGEATAADRRAPAVIAARQVDRDEAAPRRLEQWKIPRPEQRLGRSDVAIVAEGGRGLERGDVGRAARVDVERRGPGTPRGARPRSAAADTGHEDRAAFARRRVERAVIVASDDVAGLRAQFRCQVVQILLANALDL